MTKPTKTILITGASGALGSAAALKFARAGWLVFACDIRPPESPQGSPQGSPPASFPEGAEDPSIRFIQTDITSEESVQSAFEAVSSECGGLDVLLHMAGLYVMDSFLEIPPETLEKMLAVNVLGAARVNRVFLPLVQAAGGRIIVTASELAPLDPLPFNGIYSMSKRALDSVSHATALELDLIGTRLITLYPGAYGDGMTRASVREMERMSKDSRLFPDIAERFRQIVLRETGGARPPEELAERILRIAKKRRPRFKYFMNNSLKLRLFSALPTGVQAPALRLLLGKGKK